MRRQLLLPILLLAACKDGGGAAPEPSSFNRIQTQIFDTQCVSCHVAGNRFATESGLVLDAARSYTSLVGMRPTNPEARADGLLLVSPHSADRSLLYHKLHWDAGHHARSYGAPMPLGGESLSVGEIEFIRRWIEAGAPRTGDVVDAKLLEDKTRPSTAAFTPLSPPERGFQLKVGPFTVQPQFEREIFVYRRVGNPTEVLVNRIETKMRANSHHLLLYTFNSSMPSQLVPAFDVVRDLRNPNGSMNFANMLAMGYHVFFAGAMAQTSDYRFPAGVALRLPANAALDMNSHYVNKTNSELSGEAYANLHTVDASQVQHVASTLNLPNMSFELPPKQRTTIFKTFIAGSSDFPVGPDGSVRILMLTSHMHARGEKFVIRITGGPRNGEIVYTNTDWEHPAIVNYTPVIVLKRGEGLTSEVTFNNTTDRTIRFGLTSEDEMDIIFGYWY